MPELGGPTTQSGVFYQNSISALYLGRLCDGVVRPQNELVVEVRVEAPDSVDDTIITFEDQHRLYIQAKEHIQKGTKPWNKLWKDFSKQFQKSQFQPSRDRLVLYTGETRELIHNLREICERSYESQDYNEWWGRLSQAQQGLLKDIIPLVSAVDDDDDKKFILSLFRHIDVEVFTLRQIERDLVALWMPASNESYQTVFRLLRDHVGEKGRQRGIFTLKILKLILLDHEIIINTPSIEITRTSIQRCNALLMQCRNTVASTGVFIKRVVVDKIVDWIKNTPDSDNVAVLLDQAGMGKTVVMRSVLSTLQHQDIITLAIKADQHLSGIVEYPELQTMLAFSEPVEAMIRRLAITGKVVVLIDQIDALSLSLAHDQRSLDVVLQLIAYLRNIPNVRIVLSCRTFDYHNDPRFRQTHIAHHFVLEELESTDVAVVLKKLDIEFAFLAEVAKKLLKTPLHLDLFCLAMEQQATPPNYQRMLPSLTNLQDLYGLLWQNVILRAGMTVPSATDREDVLRLMTEQMHKHQRVTVAQSFFMSRDTMHLEKAVNWLGSAGILVQGNASWSFLHQTFFDYCYAKQFVESNNSLTQMIISSDQGLFVRPQLIQILTFLRGSNHRLYIQEIHALFHLQSLRFHIKDLLFRWFGACIVPTNDEWSLAQRMLIDPLHRGRFLMAIYGNLGWFERMRGIKIQALLKYDDQILDSEVIPYLDSLTEVAQTDIMQILQPYIGRSNEWNNRLGWVLSHIRHWQTLHAAEALENLIRITDIESFKNSYDLDDVTKAYPRVGCRILRIILDKVLDSYLIECEKHAKKQNYDTKWFISLPNLSRSLEALNSGMLMESLQNASKLEPSIFLEELLPWIEKVCEISNQSDNTDNKYPDDILSHDWYDTTYPVYHTLIHSIITSLTILAKTESNIFHVYADRLASKPFRTTQQLLIYVYRDVADQYTEDAFKFLLGDNRRLMLGDADIYDSRQLINTIYPFLSHQQRNDLEQYLLFNPHWNWKVYGLDALRWWRQEQMFLLQSIPVQYLSDKGLARLQELERKFPNYRVSSDPQRGGGFTIPSPIPKTKAQALSNKAWLRIMKEDQTNNWYKRSSHRGGIGELAHVLTEMIKQEPDRFYQLASQALDFIHPIFAQAFIRGFSELHTHPDRFFKLVRLFGNKLNLEGKRTVTWLLEERINEGIPDDVISMLKSWIYTSANSDEQNWENNDDLYSGSINTVRGCALRVVMQALRKQEDQITLQHQWQVIDVIAADPSRVLRAGIIYELMFLFNNDSDRAIHIFEQSIQLYPILLLSHPTQEFIYYGMFYDCSKMLPYINALLNVNSEEAQRRGAELISIAAISSKVLTPEASIEVQEIASRVLTGRALWRRGAARVYANNLIYESFAICLDALSMLLNDDDDDVCSIIGDIFENLREDHFILLHTFIKNYATSKSVTTNTRAFYNYLSEYGLLDPDWTLSVIMLTLHNPYEKPRSQWATPREEAIRIVTRIYTHPLTDVELRKQAMDVFDALMERYTGQALKVLSEWDQR